ncbi:transposase [Vibrio crassostreae]|nr:transposase [Vibrio crassostreae]CAK2768108.1 transposase [Vibrio crassostreae]CAK3223838.1 transposase [Vibrio crassostreae]CAK3837970.1 transposase [Vibrio crassostreae]
MEQVIAAPQTNQTDKAAISTVPSQQERNENLIPQLALVITLKGHDFDGIAVEIVPTNGKPFLLDIITTQGYNEFSIKYSQPKSLEQQSMQSLESSRRFLSRSVVSLGQHIRGTILGYGIANPRGEKGLKASVQAVLDGETSIPNNVVAVISMLWEQYKQLKVKLIEFEKEKNALTRQIEPCQRLMEIEGVGETTAAMLYTTLGDGKQFKNGR